MKNEAREEMRKLQSNIEKEKIADGIAYEMLISEGNLVNQVKYLAEKNRVDMIIMGTKGAGSIEGILIGSNTLDVLKNVYTPVLVIPEGVKYKKIEKIVFAFDFKKIDNPHCLNPMIRIAANSDAEIKIVNVSGDEKDNSGSEEEKRIRNYLGNTKYSFTHIKSSDTAEGLTSYINEHPTDLLVMIIREHNLLNALFHTSITKQLTFQTTIPLLVLHEKNS
jgi:hypothetical protein